MFHDFPWFPHAFPMIFHEMLNISIQIYVLGPSHFLSSPPGKLSCWPGARFGAQFAPHFMWGGLQITTATRGFNKHGEFTVSTNMKSSVALNLVLSKPTFMVCHGVSMSWFLRTNRQQKLANPQGTQVVHLPMRHDLLGMKLCSQIPNPQGLRTWLPWLMIQVVDRNKGPIRAFSGNNGPLGSSLSVPSEAICPEKILQLGQASLSGVFCWECLSIHVVL